MKAAVRRSYGEPSVVRIEEVPVPTPGAKQVLVRVHATAVTAADARIRGANFPRGYGLIARMLFGLRRPRQPILGGVASGVVEAVGSRVEGFEVGDVVCGTTGLGLGCHAELAVLPARKLVHKPAAVSHEQAAGVLFGGVTALHFLREVAHVQSGQTVLVNGASGAVGTNAVQLAVLPARKLVHKPATVSHEQAAGVLFGGVTALHFLREVAHVQPGQTVLVNGASGAVGTNAVQLAKHFGAEVTAVASATNATLLKELGADHVVDYALTPVATLAEKFDVVLDNVGNIGIPAGKRMLTPDGVMLLVVGDLSEALRARGNVKGGPSPERAESFTTLLDLVAADSLTVVNQEVVDLDDIAHAHAVVDSGRKVGNIIVKLV